MILKDRVNRIYVPKSRTITVHLNIPGPPITGLPRDLMRNSIALAKEYGGKRKWTMGFDNRIFTTTINDVDIERLKADPRVEKVIVSVGQARTSFIPYSIPNPPYNHNAVNQDWGVSKLNPTAAWGKGVYGQGVKVCVIDTGISRSEALWNTLHPGENPSPTSRFGEGPGEKTHPAFWKNGVSVYKGGKDFVVSDYAPDYWRFANDDDNGHGTWTSGLIAEQHSGIVGRYKGVAPGVELYHCKVLDIFGNGDWADVAAAVDWARENGMDIISMSLGGGSDPTVTAACAAAKSAGVLIFAAAGNSGPGADTIEYPGALASVVAVAAADCYDNVAPFSSRGADVELAAPGVEISGPMSEYWANSFYQSYPWLIIPGSFDPEQPTFTEGAERNLYMCADGTSAACPLAAGAAALIKSWFPAASNDQIVQYMKDNARDI